MRVLILCLLLGLWGGLSSCSGDGVSTYFKPANTDASDFFGLMVSLSGDTLAVVAPREASSATGINGNPADNSAPQSGAVYVFVRTGTTWAQQAYLKASNTEGHQQDEG